MLVPELYRRCTYKPHSYCGAFVVRSLLEGLHTLITPFTPSSASEWILGVLPSSPVVCHIAPASASALRDLLVPGHGGGADAAADAGEGHTLELHEVRLRAAHARRVALQRRRAHVRALHLSAVHMVSPLSLEEPHSRQMH